MDNTTFTVTDIPNINGPKLIKINNVNYDKRGSLWEIFRKDEIEEALGVQFVCDKLSVSKANVLRGLHLNHQAGKLMNVINGASCHVIVDMRKELRSIDQNYPSYSIIMRPGEFMLYVPPGFANGFYTLQEYTIVEYKLTHYYEQYSEEVVSWTVADKWPSQIYWNKIISDKDNI